MKCIQCGQKMEVRHETRRSYAGLEDVVVEGVEVRHCSSCGEEEVSYPNIEALHTRIAQSLAEKTAALTPREVRFLRTYLGLASEDLSKRMGVTRDTVVRWERGDKPLKMGPTAERLLRLMVMRESPVEQYPLERLDSVATEDAEPLHLRLKPVRSGWLHATA